MMKYLAGLFLTLAVPALGQGMDFQQLLAGKEIPYSLPLKDLNADWRRLSIGMAEGAKGGLGDMMSSLIQAGMMSDAQKGKGKNDPMDAMLGMTVLGGLFGGGGESKAPVYYTKGQTVAVGGETFLVTYRYQKPEVNFLQMAMDADKGGKAPDLNKMTASGKLAPDSLLTLSLLNVRTISTLTNIHPFDMDQEIIESAKSSSLMEFFAQQSGKGGPASKPAPPPAAPRRAPARPKSRT